MGEGTGLTTHDLVLEVREDLRRYRDEMRQRFHDFQRTWATLENRVRDLEEFQRWSTRRHEDDDRRIRALDPIVNSLVTEDRLSAGISEALRHAETRGWSRRERYGQILLILFATVGAASALVTLIRAF